MREMASFGGPLTAKESFAGQAARLLNDPRMPDESYVRDMLEMRGASRRDLDDIIDAGKLLLRVKVALSSRDQQELLDLTQRLSALGINRYPVYVRAEIQPPGSVQPGDENPQGLPEVDPVYREARYTAPVWATLPEIEAVMQMLVGQMANGAVGNDTPASGTLVAQDYHI
jgi:hypothetical protein